METTVNETSGTKQLTAIERALAAAKARKAARDATGDTSESSQSFAPKVDGTSKEKGLSTVVTVISDEDRARRRAEKEALRAAAAEQRNVDREAKKAEKAKRREEAQANSYMNRQTHMKKLESARSKLPALNDRTHQLFEQITTDLDKVQLEALALHLQFHNRLNSTKQAPTKPIPTGTTVRFVSGDHRYIGLTGTITRSQKLRSHVTVPGHKREVYTFTADLEVVDSAP